MRSLADPRVLHAAVVKSDAYGLGLAPVARALSDAGCSFFFVANLEEGVRLRSACPKVSIAVLRGDLGRYAAVYERHGLLPVVNDLGELRLIRQSLAFLPFILNVDTGLTRLGLSPFEVRSLYLERVLERLPLIGVMSHLACGAQGDDPRNELQRHRFESVYQVLQPCWGSLAASSGLWLGRRYHFDLTRLGSALYGLNDARIRPNPLQPVLRLSAPIVDVRDLCPGEGVGYGATFRPQRNSRVAIVGMGYMHGLPWSCGNRMTAHIGPLSAPVIGRVSMEYLTLDATDIPDELCHPGAWADLLDERFGVDDMADATGIAAQEILLRLGAACLRDYAAAPAAAQKAS
jgi:alanine racemase